VSTALDIAAQELAQLRRENAALKKKVPFEPRPLSTLPIPKPAAPGEPAVLPAKVTAAELAAYHRQQRAGATGLPAGDLREVVHVDRSGREVSHFFGDSSACWDQFGGKHCRVTGYNTRPK
jgi:hypothetical protein